MRVERDVGIGFGLSCRLRLKGRIPVHRGANPAGRPQQHREHVTTPKDKALKEYTIAYLKDLKTNFVENPLPSGEVLAMSRLKQNVEVLVKKRGIASKVQTRLETRGLVISLDGTFFDSGSEQLKSDGQELLDALADDLLAMKTQICIEGHTDNVPIPIPTDSDQTGMAFSGGVGCAPSA
jgi:flagellar motor protein MotB